MALVRHPSEGKNSVKRQQRTPKETDGFAGGVPTSRGDAGRDERKQEREKIRLRVWLFRAPALPHSLLILLRVLLPFATLSGHVNIALPIIY